MLTTARALLVAICCTAAAAQPLTVAHRSTVPLPNSTIDQHGEAFTISGLSGIAYVGSSSTPGLHRFAAVMDNSNRLVILDAALTGNASISSVTVVGGLTLALAADFEDIAIRADGLGVLLCEEGTPGVREFDLATGAAGPALPTPPVFFNRRDNFGFEALCLSRGMLWTANEEALVVDGPASSQSAGSLVRLLRFDAQSGSFTPGPQYAYRCEPLHGSPVSGSRSGLVALSILPSGRMLALERSFAFNLSGLFRSRLFEIALDNATEVSGLASLAVPGLTLVTKTPLWSGNLNNLEGLCVGPAPAAGGRVLLGIVDDGDPISSNALVSFHVTGPTEAPCAADSDGSGDVGVPDIFVFLGWWFASDPRADIDGTAGIAVPDIFAFLALWFAGCAA